MSAQKPILSLSAVYNEGTETSMHSLALLLTSLRLPLYSYDEMAGVDRDVV